jgi:outer membrane murein-binding lipoprotein Lpp
VERTNGAVDEKVKNPYAIGMAAAMKATGDKPPLEKSTINKAHDSAKSVEKNEGEMDESMTRQHFQYVADMLKNIEDVTKRAEYAQHHSAIFQHFNPNFDHEKFMQAAGVYTVTKGENTEAPVGNEDAANTKELESKLEKLEMKYNAQMANAYAGDPAETEEEIAKIEKQLGITHEEKKMKKNKMNESVVIATDTPAEASMMMQLLQLAGVKPVDQSMLNQPEVKADEDYANTANVKVSDIRAATPNGTDMNRQKGSYNVAAGGDNPMDLKMGESEITEEQLSNSLRSQYESFKQAYQEANAKPDFLDMDKDGNKTEPMKKALKDKEKK